MVDIEYIRKKRFVEGWPIRKISRQLQVSRQSVRKALASAEKKPYTLKNHKPSPVMDPFRDVILKWLKEDMKAPAKQRHTAKRIYDRLLKEFEFAGSESAVRRFVAGLRRELNGPDIEPFFVLEADPGEMAQVDWGQAVVNIDGVAKTIHIFCLRLRASSVPFVWACLHERMEAFLEGHVRGFEWLGGVPKKIVYDNLTTAVQKILNGHDRQLQDRYITLRSHYLFESVFCNPASGNEKGSVENLVGYVRRNALTPVPQVASLDELNSHLLAWCDRERRRHQEQWDLERKHLRSIPAETFRPCVSWVLPVSKLSLITYDRNRYSVPTEYIGRNLRVDVYSDRLEMWHLEQKVATHTRLYGRNRDSLQLAHYLTALARKPYAATHAAVVRDLPEPYQRARKVLCDSDLSGYRELVRILLLHREFPAEALREAVVRALERRQLSADAIRQDLLNTSTPTVSSGSVVVPDQFTDMAVTVGNPRTYDELLGVGA